MDFTFEFIQMFFIALWHVAPVILLLAGVILILGRLVGIGEDWSGM